MKAENKYIFYWERIFIVILFFYPIAISAQEQPLALQESAPIVIAKDVFSASVKEVVKEKLPREKFFNFAVEFVTSAHGQQTFDVIDSNEFLISRLKYPHRGQQIIFKGELYILPRLSFGGRFSSSHILQLSDANSTDTDWKVATANLVYTEYNSTTKTEVNFFDANIYGRVLGLDRSKDMDPISKLFDFLLISQESSLFLDFFGGYQYNQGRYGTYDLIQRIYDYVHDYANLVGEDTFYKINYRGPRLGVRGEYSYKRLATRISFAYSWLKTKGEGYWNLRQYPFSQRSDGYDGYGITLEGEISYQFTKYLAAGFGYNFMRLNQHKMRESGHEAGEAPYTEYDIVRNVNSTLYGPSVFVRVNW